MSYVTYSYRGVLTNLVTSHPPCEETCVWNAQLGQMGRCRELLDSHTRLQWQQCKVIYYFSFAAFPEKSPAKTAGHSLMYVKKITTKLLSSEDLFLSPENTLTHASTHTDR